MALEKLRLMCEVENVEHTVATTTLSLLSAIADLQTGTLAAPPATLAVGEFWLDTTGAGGADNPIVRVNLA